MQASTELLKPSAGFLGLTLDAESLTVPLLPRSVGRPVDYLIEVVFSLNVDGTAADLWPTAAAPLYSHT